MFGIFSKRRRFNGDVSALLPAFEFNLREAGEIKTLDSLDIAWRNGYSIYEAALYVAYLVYSGMLKQNPRRASIVLKRINYVQTEWIHLGIVNSTLADGFSTKAAEWLARSKLNQSARNPSTENNEKIKNSSAADNKKNTLNLSGNMPDVTSKEPYERHDNSNYFILFSENVKSIAERITGVSLGISYLLVATAVDKKTGLPAIFVTLEKSATGGTFICYFDENGAHANLGNGEDFLSRNSFRKKAGEVIHEVMHIPIYF